MGNAQVKESVLDYDTLLPGQTVVMGNKTNDTQMTLGVVTTVEKDVDIVTATVQPIQDKDTTTAPATISMALDELTLAEQPRTPYESAYEEAAVAWLKGQVKALIENYEETSMAMYKQQGPSSPKQRRGSRKSTGINVVGLKETDAMARTQIMLDSAQYESMYLGFLSMALPKVVEQRLDVETWKALDLAEIAQKIHESLVWRYEREAHALLDWSPPGDLMKRLPGGLLGVDKKSRPVLYFLASHVDFDNVTGDEIEKVEIRKQEQLNVALQDLNVRHIVCIVNVEYMGMSVIKWVSQFKRLTWVSEQLYPGRTCKTLVINASSTVKRVYNNIVSPFLSAHTKGLTDLCLKGEETIQTLQKYLPVESIPRYLGGSAGSDPNDVMCAEALYPGGYSKNAMYTMELYLKEVEEKTKKVGEGQSIEGDV
jgi:hypothetical protein